LADLGAEVIKIEMPGSGDDSRRMKPPQAGDEAHFYLAFNRNKKSVAVDLKQVQGRELIDRLAAVSDVLVENFRPGVMQRLGLDQASMRERHPRLVYCSVSAYGQAGPMADRPGLDPVLQAEMGLMSLAGEIDGDPLRHPLSIIDSFTSLYAATAISAALVEQRETGRGRYIDLSLMGGAISLLGNMAQYYFISGENPPRMGNGFPTAAPVGAFEGSDGGLFYLACGTQRLYENLVTRALERPDLVSDPRFDQMHHRVTNREALMSILRDIFRGGTRDHWVERIRAAQVPAGPVRSVSEALESAEVQAAGLVQSVTHPTAGTLRMLRSPIHLPDGPTRADSPPPLLGEHTDGVLAELLDLDAAQLAALRASGAIA
ncbi:MAG: CoA transferase, partial [Gammaproteobacteria bacterium]|nr:CoA transferase [Gammaproteobacteria bacterium]